VLSEGGNLDFGTNLIRFFETCYQKRSVVRRKEKIDYPVALHFYFIIFFEKRKADLGKNFD